MNNTYDTYAEIYDFDLGNVEKDVAIYKQLINNNKDILILSCGTGREIKYLESYCSSIDGLDISENMLIQAKNKLYQKNVNFYHQDMCNFIIDKKYDFIIIPNNGILHLLNHEDVEKCLLCCKKHLNDKGKILFDFSIFLDNNNNYIVDYHKFNKEINKEVIRSRIISKNSLTRKSETKVIYEFISSDSTITKKITNYKLKHYYPDELKLIIRLCDLKIENLYGNFNLELYNENKHYHIFFELSA